MTTYNTKNPVPSADARDRYDNSQVFDDLMNGAAPSTPDRLGVLRQSWAGMEQAFAGSEADRAAAFQAFLEASGWSSLGTYASGINIISHTQTVDYQGQPYQLKPSVPASLDAPHVTTGDWATDGVNFKLVGDNSLRQDLAEVTGSDILGFERSDLSEQVGKLSRFLSAQPKNIWEFEDFVTDRPGVSPDTWDWTQATNEAAKLGGIIEFPDGVYTYRPTTQYFADGATRICAVRFGSDTLVRFSPNTKIVSRDNDTAFDYREIFLAMGVSNTVFSGGGLFDGGLLPDASNVAALPKVGITIRASSWCEIVDLRAQDFAYHGFAAYASEVGGCSDVTFRRLKSKRGRASSIIMYSSVANAGHAPNRRMRVIDCEGSESGQFFGIELRGCIDSEIVGGSYHNNKVGGVNIEENSHRVRVHGGTEIYGNVQGGIVSGSQGACNDVTWEDVYIHNNSGSQLSNFAGNRMKVIRSRILDGGSVGVNVLVTAGGVVADGVELIDTVVTGHASTGFVSRGANAKITNGTVITGNGGADVQVSNDGLQYRDSTVGVFAYDKPARQVVGTTASNTTLGVTWRILARLGVDEERSRLVGASVAGVDYGSVEFVRQGAGSGRVEVFGYLANARKLLATFTREGDIQLATSSRGLIVVAPDNGKWRIRVNNAGAIVTEAVV